ncbi:MAG: 4Fe-4S binding protein, partial [Planctomycetota bacterium]
CESECPVNAISESGEVRIINADLCTDCGNCVAVCPVEAILAP